MRIQFTFTSKKLGFLLPFILSKLESFTIMQGQARYYQKGIILFKAYFCSTMRAKQLKIIQLFLKIVRKFKTEKLDKRRKIKLVKKYSQKCASKE